MKTLAIIGMSLVTPLMLWLSGGKTVQRANVLTGGNPDSGRAEIEYYGCTSCHVVPGVPGADGLVGPSLKHVANRNYIGGVIENTPENLIRWIEHAPAVDPKTAMPDLQIPDRPARDIASYLYTLE
jgi:cytochrome c551/c552